MRENWQISCKFTDSVTSLCPNVSWKFIEEIRGKRQLVNTTGDMRSPGLTLLQKRLHDGISGRDPTSSQKFLYDDDRLRVFCASAGSTPRNLATSAPRTTYHVFISICRDTRDLSSSRFTSVSEISRHAPFSATAHKYRHESKVKVEICEE